MLREVFRISNFPLPATPQICIFFKCITNQLLISFRSRTFPCDPVINFFERSYATYAQSLMPLRHASQIVQHVRD